MQCVTETPVYLASIKSAKMSADEQIATINFIAANPLAGDLIVKGKGLRKVRIAGKGKGKSGGYRVIYYYWSENKPIELYFAFAKNQMSNLSDAQLGRLLAALES